MTVRIDHPPSSGLPGILLRQIEPIDMAAWYAYLSLPGSMSTPAGTCTPRRTAPQFEGFASAAPDSIRRMAIVDQATAGVIGTIGFHTVSTANRAAEIAYDLSPAYWGRGIARAVCASVTAWSFSHYGFQRVRAVVLRSNARSARVLAACGYRCGGLLRSYRMVQGPAGTSPSTRGWPLTRLDPWTRGPAHAAGAPGPSRLQSSTSSPPAARDTQIRIERFASRSASLST